MEQYPILVEPAYQWSVVCARESFQQVQSLVRDLRIESAAPPSWKRVRPENARGVAPYRGGRVGESRKKAFSVGGSKDR